MSKPNSSVATDNTVRLPDGRLLGYADCGDIEGKPLFLFHGWPGSRLEAKFFDTEMAKAGIRIVGLDRPGMGLSDYQPGRQILDWPDDVVAVADALEVDCFAVLGDSGGGPYALACAYKIPDRLTDCGVISSIGPSDFSKEGMSAMFRMLFLINRWLPWLLRPMLWMSLGRNSQNEEKLERMLLKMKQGLPEPDRKVMDGTVIDTFREEISESFRQGAKGPAYDGRLYGRSWGFRLKDIAFDRVHLWHGELDWDMPISMGRAMAEAIPNCQATFYPNDAHMSIISNHMEDIIAALLS